MRSVHPKIQALEAKQLKESAGAFHVGDTVRVHTLIVEGDKERVQIYEGVVIRKKRGGLRASFTVRKVSYGVGVERIFPIHSPRVQDVQVVARGKVRRARLYYLRDLSGKAARVTEDIS